MKHIHTLRLLALITALGLLLTGCLLPVSAEEESYTRWSAKGDTVTAEFPDGSSKTYTPVKLSNRLRFFHGDQFRYEESLRTDDELFTVVAPGYKSMYILLDDHVYASEDQLLATAQGHTLLSSLGKGRVEYYQIHASDNYYASIGEGLLAALRDAPAKNTVTYTLFELKDLQCYEIFGMFYEADWFGYVEGYVFETADGLFYADARSLPDSAFGSNARLQPKTTESITLIPLDEELTDSVYDRIANLQNHTVSYDAEEDYIDIVYDPEQAMRGITMATVIILGIVCPIAPITLGLCLPHSKNLGYKKRWYLLTALGGVWLAAGVLLLVLLCTVM